MLPVPRPDFYKEPLIINRSQSTIATRLRLFVGTVTKAIPTTITSEDAIAQHRRQTLGVFIFVTAKIQFRRKDVEASERSDSTRMLPLPRSGAVSASWRSQIEWH
jgi:hypothetical protein